MCVFFHTVSGKKTPKPKKNPQNHLFLPFFSSLSLYYSVCPLSLKPLTSRSCTHCNDSDACVFDSRAQFTEGFSLFLSFNVLFYTPREPPPFPRGPSSTPGTPSFFPLLLTVLGVWAFLSCHILMRYRRGMSFFPIAHLLNGFFPPP